MLPTDKDLNAPGSETKPHKVEPSQKTWFFQRPNGEIFGVHATEAWQLLQKTSEYQRALKLVGCSDGSIFQNAVQESHKVFMETKDVEKAKEVLRKGEKEEIEKARGNMELPPDPSRVQFKRQP